MTQKARSYTDEVVYRLEKLSSDYKVEKIGEVNYPIGSYTLYRVAAGNREKMAVVLSGGVHGNEPAGVYTSLNFLEKEAHLFLDDFCFFLIHALIL